MLNGNSEIMLWNMILTALLAVLGVMAKSKFDHIDKIATLLSHTREEIARDNITRSEYSRDLDKIMDRLDAGILRLENKIDEFSRRS